MFSMGLKATGSYVSRQAFPNHLSYLLLALFALSIKGPVHLVSHPTMQLMKES